jgi:adenylate cyclase
MAAAALRQGVREDDVLQILRAFAVCMRQVALAMRDFFRNAVEEPRLADGLSHRQMLENSAPLRLVFQQMGFRAVHVLLGRYLEQAILENVINRLLDGLADAGVTEAVSRVRTIVFLDVCGFTQLTERQGDSDAAEISARFGEIVQTSCGQHGGRLVKLLGDGAMLEFRDGRRAIACARRIIEEASERELPPVRGGLSSGPVVARDGDAFGHTVNLAARLLASAPPGGIWLAADALGDAVGHDFRALGPTTLRGLSRPIEVLEWRPPTFDREGRLG